MIRKIHKNFTFLTVTIGNFSFLSPVIKKFKKRFPCYVLPDTDICIEGFPRSGNSFFVAAFLRWNNGLTVTHHTHLSSNAKSAVKQGKPAVVLIRTPEEAVASAIAWNGQLLPWVGLFNYVSFYRSLKRYRQEILFLDFHDVVNQPHKCIEKINQRFGTSFNTREYTPEESRQIREQLAQHDTFKKRSEMSSTLPNEQKASVKRTIIPRIKTSRLFSRAQSVYAEHTAITAKISEPNTD